MLGAIFKPDIVEVTETALAGYPVATVVCALDAGCGEFCNTRVVTGAGTVFVFEVADVVSDVVSPLAVSGVVEVLLALVNFNADSVEYVVVAPDSGEGVVVVEAVVAIIVPVKVVAAEGIVAVDSIKDGVLAAKAIKAAETVKDGVAAVEAVVAVNSVKD